MNLTKNEQSIDRLVQAVYDLGRIMRQRMMQCHTGELHMGQIHALLLIQEREGITMKELASLLHVTSPSATAFADRLVRLGYVERMRDPENRRVVRLRILPKGTDMLASKMAERRRIFTEILGILPESDQRILAEILRKVLSGCPS
jgi:MarR family transcriptional regulator, organic hydroperoxide resistance regulator